MSTTVLVYCPDCTEGTAPDGLGCVMCSAMGHIAVDREPDGSVPALYLEWLPMLLPLIRNNPLTLRTDAPEAETQQG